MPEVRWTEDAVIDRDAIFDYIRRFDPSAAFRMDLRFEHAAKRLALLPMLGREGQIPGTRELIPHPNYRIVYEVATDTIWILTVVHVAREWPPVERD